MVTGTFEVIVNPLATIGLVTMLLISATALAFIAILFACGVRPEDLAQAEEN